MHTAYLSRNLRLRHQQREVSSWFVFINNYYNLSLPAYFIHLPYFNIFLNNLIINFIHFSSLNVIIYYNFILFMICLTHFSTKTEKSSDQR